MNRFTTFTVNSALQRGEVRGFIALISLSLIWGSSYILIKRGLVAFDPIQLGALRATISGICFAPFLILRMRKIDWRKWPYLFLVGLTSAGLPAILFPLAQQGISSSMAGIFNALTPLFTLLIGILFFRTGFKWSKLSGVLIGLTGAVLLVLYSADSKVEGSAVYALLAIGGAVCYAVSSNTVGAHLKAMGSLDISVAAFGMMTVPAAVYLFGMTDFFVVLTKHSGGWTAFGYIFFLALFSTVIASVLYFQLIKWTNALFASTVTYLAPLVALSWGMLDGEIITRVVVMGMALILWGVYLSRR